MQPRKYLMIGAHPDDLDILCGGTAVKLVRAGHIVKFVSVTNGDGGRHAMERANLAGIRVKEAAADQLREVLKAEYGAERGGAVRYAETFEQSDYSRTLPSAEFRRLFIGD